MTLGHRCEEIVRLIDETLASVGTNPAATVDVSTHPSAASRAERVRSSLATGRRDGPHPAGRDRRAAVGRLRLLRDPGPVDGPGAADTQERPVHKV